MIRPCKSQRFTRPLPLVFPAFWHLYCTPSSSLLLAHPAPTSAGMMRGSPGPTRSYGARTHSPTSPPSRPYGATGSSGSHRLTPWHLLERYPFSAFSVSLRFPRYKFGPLRTNLHDADSRGFSCAQPRSQCGETRLLQEHTPWRQASRIPDYPHDEHPSVLFQSTALPVVSSGTK